MAERTPTEPILSIQRWIEKDIIGQGICVPLVTLARDFKGEDGKIDWARFSTEIVIEDATDFVPNTKRLSTRAYNWFMTYVEATVDGTAPMATNLICPDFRTNSDFDLLYKKILEGAYNRFTLDQTGQEFAIRALLQLAARHRNNEPVIRGLVSGDPISKAHKLVKDGFLPSPFYGRRVQDVDVVGFPDDEGYPIERNKLLARAPFYLLQLTDPYKAYDLIANTNIDAMHRKNNRLAARTDYDDLEQVMADLRQNP